MAYVISLSIFKGGTGKTISVVMTAAALVQKKQRVLLVDLDQQASSTRYVGINPDQVDPAFYAGKVDMSGIVPLAPRKKTRARPALSRTNERATAND